MRLVTMFVISTFLIIGSNTVYSGTVWGNSYKQCKPLNRGWRQPQHQGYGGFNMQQSQTCRVCQKAQKCSWYNSIWRCRMSRPKCGGWFKE